MIQSSVIDSNPHLRGRQSGAGLKQPPVLTGNKATSQRKVTSAAANAKTPPQAGEPKVERATPSPLHVTGCCRCVG